MSTERPDRLLQALVRVIETGSRWLQAPRDSGVRADHLAALSIWEAVRDRPRNEPDLAEWEIETRPNGKKPT